MYEYEKGDKTQYKEWYNAQYKELGYYHWKKERSILHAEKVADMFVDFDNILDVGCGDCLEMSVLLKAGKKVTGIDISDVAIEMGMKKLNELGLSPAHLVIGDCTKMGFADNEFDAALCSDVIEHLTPEDATKMLNEIRRVCKPGAKIVISTANRREEPIKVDFKMPYLSSSHILEYTPKELKEKSQDHMEVDAVFTGGSAIAQRVKLWISIPEPKLYLIGRNKK